MCARPRCFLPAVLHGLSSPWPNLAFKRGSGLERSLVITEEQRPNYAQPRLGAESGELYVPPTTHFIAIVEDLTNMLGYGSQDIDGMDDDAGEEQAQNPPFTGR